MTVAEPAHPAVADYPTDGPYAQQVEAAFKLFKEELEGHEGWEDQGEREGVQLFRKPDPDDACKFPAWPVGHAPREPSPSLQSSMRCSWDGPHSRFPFVICWVVAEQQTTQMLCRLSRAKRSSRALPLTRSAALAEFKPYALVDVGAVYGRDSAPWHAETMG